MYALIFSLFFLISSSFLFFFSDLLFQTFVGRTDVSCEMMSIRKGDDAIKHQQHNDALLYDWLVMCYVTRMTGVL